MNVLVPPAATVLTVETIRSAGLYNQKAQKIIGAAEWVLAEYGSMEAFDEFVAIVTQGSF